MNTKNSIPLSLAMATAFVTGSVTTNAALIYKFDYDSGGSGTTVVDSSGFGTQDNAISYDSTSATANRVASTGLTVSPDGGNYGNFATDDRRSISSFGDKWNDGTTGPGATGEVTVSFLFRDMNLSGGTDKDGAFFRTDNGGSQLTIEPDSTGGTSTTLQLNVPGSSASTSVAADLSNSTAGNGWNLLAFTYSAGSSTGKVYLGREFSSTTGTWGSFGQVGTDLSLSGSIPNMDLGAATRAGFGTSSGSSQQFNGDDFRIYNEVLSESAIGDLYVVPEPATFALMFGAFTFGLVMWRRRSR